MNRSIIIKAENSRAAVKKAAEYFQVNRNLIKFKIISTESRGLFKPKVFRIRCWVKQQKPLAQPEGFTLFYSNGEAWLKIPPSTENTPPPYLEDILARARLLRIPHPPVGVIQKALEERSGEPISMGTWSYGKNLSSRIQIEVTETKMEAFLLITAPKKGGSAPAIEEILKALTENLITQGIDTSSIRRMLDHQIFDQKILIAKGKPAKGGYHSRVEYLFNTQPGKPYLELDFGRINLKELDFIQNKRKDDPLASLIPPIPGETGFTVEGTLLHPPEPPPAEVLRSGTNTRIEGDTIFAEIDGNAILKDDAVHIESVVHLKDVNYETGNIHTEGSVIIDETIADGFTVIAGGNVQIGKCVGKAEVKAGGDIILRSGINGNKEGSLTAGGDIYSKYIESALIKNSGNIIVEEAVMNSYVQTSGSLLFTGRRAELLGGTTVTGQSLWCKKLGNAYEIPTQLIIGVSPRLVSHFYEMNLQAETLRTELNSLNDDIQRWKKRIERGLTDDDYELKLLKGNKRQGELTRFLEKIQNESIQIRRGWSPDPQAVAVIEETAYKGCVITFGSEEVIIPPKGVRKTCFCWENNKIVEKGFHPHNPPSLKLEIKPETPSE